MDFIEEDGVMEAVLGVHYKRDSQPLEPSHLCIEDGWDNTTKGCSDRKGGKNEEDTR